MSMKHMANTTLGNQRGYVLFVMLAILLSVASIAAVRFAGRQSLILNSGKLTSQESLEEARAGLIMSAMWRDANPGALPCPDTDGDGETYSCTAVASQTAARFPYKSAIHADAIADDKKRASLKAAATPLKDAYGECIWYALTPSFRNSVVVEQRKATDPDKQPLNPNTAGTIVYNGEQVIAVLISPGLPFASQSRCRAGDSGCPASSGCSSGAVSDYLESLGEINNAGSTGQFAGSTSLAVWDKATSKCVLRTSISKPENAGSECNNDVILPITKKDILRPLIKEVLTRLTATTYSDAIPGLRSQLGTAVNTTLDTIRIKDPFAFDSALFGPLNTVDDPKNPGTKILDIGANDCMRSLSPSKDERPMWLCSNDWYRFITFDRATDSLSISLNASPTSSAYRCTASLTTRDVKCQ